MRIPIYAMLPTEKQHLATKKRMHGLTRCCLGVSDKGLNRAKPTSYFAAGNALRARRMLQEAETIRLGLSVRREMPGMMASLMKLRDLCNQMGEIVTAAEQLLEAGEPETGTGKLLVDTGLALRIQAAIAVARSAADGVIEAGASKS